MNYRSPPGGYQEAILQALDSGLSTRREINQSLGRTNNETAGAFAELLGSGALIPVARGVYVRGGDLDPHRASPKSGEGRQHIVRVLRSWSQPFSALDLIVATGLRRTIVSVTLSRLTAEGVITRVGRGLYESRKPAGP